VVVANARHLASPLARQAAVLQTRSAKAQRKASNCISKIAAVLGGIFYEGDIK
jgi:hypothetical protein